MRSIVCVEVVDDFPGSDIACVPGFLVHDVIKPVKEGEEREIKDTKHIPKKEIPNLLIELDAKMRTAADNLDFEEAIRLRDKAKELEKRIN